MILLQNRAFWLATLVIITYLAFSLTVRRKLRKMAADGRIKEEGIFHAKNNTEN